ncbi:uncharacterized protein LOC113232255 isoform X2 [Hyposmocoma kahamanoa]|uniref:uncharacterized protein LOC113232255 isoform X2 n=1 Tax=Hyposmocoma kahamanoa TaxID=1477025 RepID=UPI000E6D5BE1|nr:uncharacterized protein LOC113232255 isoform X2 [Hyposmocoma kahamanoa]
MSKEESISINKGRCKANAAPPKINIKTKEISANETRVMCTSLNIRSDPVIHLYEIRGKELYVTTEQSITGTANFTVKTNVTGKVLTIFCGARPNNETYTEFIISELVKLRRSNVSINQQSTNKNQTISGTTNSPENNEQSNAENNEQSIIGVIAGASIGSLLLILVIILFICKIRSNGQIPDACAPKVYYKTVKYSGNGTPDAQIDGVSKPKENCTSEVHYAEICVSNSITASLPPRDETTYAKIIGILKPKERKV